MSVTAQGIVALAPEVDVDVAFDGTSAANWQKTMVLMRQQQAELLRSGEGAAPPAELFSDKRFVFRTKPAARIVRLQHTVDARPEDNGDKRSEFLIRRWDKRHPDKADRELLEYIHDVVGRTFTFTPISGKRECYFATDDQKVADYLRSLMNRRLGEFANVYEESGNRRLRVGDMEFPATALGRQTALAYAEKNGIAEIRFVDTEDDAPAPTRKKS